MRNRGTRGATAAAHMQRWPKLMNHAIALTVAMVVAWAPIAAAQSYAGKWEASGGSTRTCPELNAHINVVGSNISITIAAALTYTLKGTVAADGSFTAETPNGAASASGKFSGDTVDFVLKVGCGSRGAKGRRVS